MELIIISSNFIKIVFTTALIYFLYIKIINYKKNDLYKTIFIILSSIIIALLYIMLIKIISPLITITMLYFIYGLIIKNIIEKDVVCYSAITYIISCVMAYIIYFISTIISGFMLLLILHKKEFTNPISLVFIPMIAVLLFYAIFKIKRFKNGFNFLKNEEKNKDIRNFAVFWVGIILIIFGFFQKTNDEILALCVILGTVCIILNVAIWIKSQITKTYKSKMRDRTIEIQKTEIDEQAKIMEELKEENLKLATAIHKYNKKFSALEFAMKNALELETKTEFAEELSVILEETKETSNSFAEEVQVNKNKLPLTNFVGIDNMFKYMQEEASKNNINFDLKLNTSINPLIDNIISKDKFETLVGDHLKDAIIAVNASKELYKSILVTLGLVEGTYEFSVYDTGIEFEIDTLLKLGEEKVTTHKNEGGSGIGFMTTFETLRESKASLVIEECNPETTNYTKSVTIKFDGRNEYKIISYRAEKLKEQKHKRRIIIEKLK